MRLAIRVLVVAICLALFIAGGRSPRHPTTTNHRSATTPDIVIERFSQPPAQAQPPADHEQPTAAQAGRDDPPVIGAAAKRAGQAAQAAAPGATVHQVEREANDDDNPRSAYEVELTRPDGSTVEVDLDASYKLLATQDSRND
jgi:hypothetical protein